MTCHQRPSAILDAIRHCELFGGGERDDGVPGRDRPSVLVTHDGYFGQGRSHGSTARIPLQLGPEGLQAGGSFARLRDLGHEVVVQNLCQLLLVPRIHGVQEAIQNVLNLDRHGDDVSRV